jgi:hypothetical protein
MGTVYPVPIFEVSTINKSRAQEDLEINPELENQITKTKENQ